MSVFDDIQDQINKRAAELLLPRFLDLEAKKHARNGFREGCPCTYCRAKRAATSEIGHLGRAYYDADGIMKRVPPPEGLDPWELSRYTREVLRDSLRQKHQRILKELFNG